MRRAWVVAPVVVIALGAFLACGGDDNAAGGGNGDGPPGGGPRDGSVLEDGAVAPTETCKSEGGTAGVQQPAFVRNLNAGETGWFASPAIVDLDGDGKPE